MNARWQITHTEAGYHLVLIGGNGEKVMTSEVYTSAQAARDAHHLARVTFLSGSTFAPLAVVEE